MKRLRASLVGLLGLCLSLMLAGTALAEPMVANVSPPDESIINTAWPEISAFITNIAQGDLEILSLTVDGESVAYEFTPATNRVAMLAPGVNPLKEGEHGVWLRVREISSSVVTEIPWNFTVDTIPPSVSLTGPTGFINDTTPEITGSVGDTRFARASLLLDGAEVLAPTEGGFTFESPVLTPGPHTFVLRAWDRAENVAEATVTFTVDIEAPGVEYLGPLETVATNAPTISARITDDRAGVNWSSLAVILDTTDVSTSVTREGDLVSYAASGLGEGTHYIYFKVGDNSVAANTTERFWPFNVDTIAPTITITSPAEGAFVNVQVPPITAELVDVTSGIDPNSIRVFIDGSEIGGDDGNPWTFSGTTLTITPPELSDGPHTVSVTAADYAGLGADSGVRSFVVDTTPPVVTDIRAFNDDDDPVEAVKHDAEYWTWTANDGSGSGLKEMHVIFFDPSGNVHKAETSVGTNLKWVSPGNVWHTGYGEPEQGIWKLEVHAVDNVGNETLASGTVIVDRCGPPAPVMYAEPHWTPGLTNTISWTAPVDIAGIAKYKVLVWNINQLQDHDPFDWLWKEEHGRIVEVDGAFTSAEIDGLEDGAQYNYAVKAVDKAGNVGDWSNEVFSFQDAAPPTAPGAPDPGVALTTSKRPTWTWTASIDDGGPNRSGFAYYLVQIKTAGGSPVGNSIVTQGNTFVPGADLADGSYKLSVKAKDNAGNFSAEVEGPVVTIDTTPPVVSNLKPVDGTTVKTTKAAISFDASGYTSLVLRVDGQIVGLRTVDGESVTGTGLGTIGNKVVYAPATRFAAGRHTLELELTDAAGNVTKAFSAFTVELYREGFGFGRLWF